MKKAIILVVGILIISGFAAGGTTSSVDISTKIDSENEYVYSVDDISAIRYLSAMYPEINTQEISDIQSVTLGRDYPIGDTIWQYTISTSWDNSPKAIAPIEDINGDNIDDVIVCSEDDYVRCFDGGAIGTGSILWEHEIYAGDIYSQKGLDIIEDVDGDGYEDVVVGATGGARLIRCISGDSGTEIWTHDTHEYGDGGWVYQVDCSYDYDGDGITDVLASTGDDSSDNGPKRAYCLDGEDGISIWERPLGGAGFSVIGVEDFTGDGQPDVLAGCTNQAETTGYAKGINGDTGVEVWSYTTPGSSVWALEQIDDITGDNIKDVIIGDFYGNIYGLDATNGDQEYSNSVGGIITRFAKLTDVNNDGHPDIVPAHSSSHTTQAIDGQTGIFIWSYTVADQPWNVARISDVSGDAIDDVLVGTLYQSNYCYFLDGTDGSELESIAYGQAVDAIYSIPDVVADGSMEMVAGGRDGKVTCISGGLDATGPNNPPTQPTINGPETGIVDVSYDFTFVSTDLDGDEVYYYVDWGDGTSDDWFGPYASGAVVTVSHSWSSEDTYSILAKVKDENDAESSWSDPFEIMIQENNPPNAPDIDGPANGEVGSTYTYTFTSTDPDDDDVAYYIDWGDGTTTSWTAFQASGTAYSESHTWSSQGTYTIVAKAKDVHGLEGPEGTLDVTMPRNKIAANTLLLRFLQQFPNAFPLLRLLLRL